MTKIFRLCLFGFMLVACSKDPSVWKISNLEGGVIRVIGHGGMGEKYRHPMNSLTSLKDVLALGVYGTEMDVQMTKDNVLVLYHHGKLENGTRCEGKIREKTWKEISDCEYKQPLFSGEKIIRAQDFFDKQDKGNFYFAFDCKVEANDNPEYINNFSKELYELVVKYNLQEKCFIESYSLDYLRALYQKDPGLKLFVHADSYREALAVSRAVKLYGITMDKLRISAEEIRMAHKEGLRVALFNAGTDRENLEAIEMQPDFIQSDNCTFLLEALR